MAQQAIVAEKVGMTQRWVDDKVVPVTVLRVELDLYACLRPCRLYPGV
jgi:ribosomal protein L3